MFGELLGKASCLVPGDVWVCWKATAPPGTEMRGRRGSHRRADHTVPAALVSRQPGIDFKGHCYTNILEALNTMHFCQSWAGKSRTASNNPFRRAPQWPSLFLLAPLLKGSTTSLFAEDKAFNMEDLGTILDDMIAWNRSLSITHHHFWPGTYFSGNEMWQWVDVVGDDYNLCILYSEAVNMQIQDVVLLM